jgi:hypothetical protein
LVLGTLSEDWWVPINPDIQPVVAVPDIAKYPLFANHPAHALPGLRSFMAFPFHAPEPAGIGGLGLANLREGNFGNFRVTCALSQISSLAATALCSPETSRTGLAEDRERAGFHENGSVLELEPAGRFLFSTLVKRPAVRSRNNMSYLIVRAWRAAIKDYQLSAMQAVKDSPPSSLIVSVGEELTDAVRGFHGGERIKNVVPIPCGNSGREECLSTRIAANVATRLGARYSPALKPQGGHGHSHPRKTASLRAYDVKERLTGLTLVVDDIATSGRHLELGAQALRCTETPVLGIAWIGG